jgi:hypothetical protein
MNNWTLGQLGQNKAKQTQNEPKMNPNKPNFSQRGLCRSRNKPNFVIPTPESIPKISCLMAQGFLCCAHVFVMLWIKKEFFGENLQ